MLGSVSNEKGLIRAPDCASMFSTVSNKGQINQGGLSSFCVTLAATVVCKGGAIEGMFSWLQFSTSPVDVIKSLTHWSFKSPKSNAFVMFPPQLYAASTAYFHVICRKPK